MNNSIVKLIIGIIIISIIVGLIVLVVNKNIKNYARPDYNCTAVVYHSEMLGMDAGDDESIENNDVLGNKLFK